MKIFDEQVCRLVVDILSDFEGTGGRIFSCKILITTGLLLNEYPIQKKSGSNRFALMKFIE